MTLKINQAKEPGYIVKTAPGIGRTKHSDNLVNGKIMVYMDDGRKLLIDRSKIKIIGFVD